MAWCFQFSHFHCTLNSVLLFFSWSFWVCESRRAYLPVRRPCFCFYILPLPHLHANTISHFLFSNLSHCIRRKMCIPNLHCTYIRCDFVARNPFFIAAYATMPELFTCKTYLYSIWSKTNKQKIGKMSVSLYPFCWWFFLFLLLCHFFGSIQLFCKNRMRGRNVWMKVRRVNFHLSVRAVAFKI